MIPGQVFIDIDASEEDMAASVKHIIKKRLDNQEHFVAQYLAATGYKIEDTVMVEQRSRDGLTTIYWCEPKGTR